MHKKMVRFVLCCLLLLAALACNLGCGREIPAVTPAVVEQAAELAVQDPSPQPTLAPLPTAVEQAAATATLAPPPEPTPTSTPEPVAAERPFEGPVPEGALARIGRGAAMAMAVSPDGDSLAIATTIGVYLYRTDTMTTIWFAPFQLPVMNVLFTPDGTRLAAFTILEIHLLDTAQGEEIGVRPRFGLDFTAAFSLDGALLATADSRVISLWDTTTGEQRGELSGHSAFPRSLAWTPDGDWLVSGGATQDGQTGEIFVWNPTTGEVVRQFGAEHSREVTALAFNADGSRLLAKGGREVIVWDFAAGTPLHIIESSQIISIAWSPDDALFAFGLNQGHTLVYDAASATELYEATDQRVTIRAVAFSPDSSLLYTFDPDGSIYQREAATGALRQSATGFANGMHAGVWSPDGETIWAGTVGQQIVQWEVETFARLHLEGGFGDAGLSGFQISALAFNPERTLLAVGGTNGRLYLYDPTAHELIAAFGDRDTGHRFGIHRLDWSPDGERIASSGSDDVVIIWDVAAQAPLVRFEDDEANFRGDVKFTPDGSAVIVTSRDRAIYLLDIASGAIEPQWSQHLEQGIPTGLAWHPREPNLFAVGSMQVIIWDLTSDEAVRLMAEDRAFSFPKALAFSPDGTRIAAGGESGDVAVWDVATGAMLAAYKRAHTLPVHAVIFSPDGGRFATIAQDGAILIWPAP